jgi:tRNA A-37 threonylcarbamoyl transferase component Bud32
LQGRHDQLVLGVYRLRERIGEGAMGQVFKAWNSKTDRLVAVKTIHRQITSEKAMERFRREMQTAEQLDHPNICRMIDDGELDGRPYLVMEFLDGIDLSRRVKTHGALPIGEAAEYARQAAIGLQHALERGIVHRDIKPANLMVSTIHYLDQPLAVVKILDFGLARYESEQDDNNRLTAVGKMLGTVDYVSPEQATDARNADIRADIYSLGCSLYFLLTGQPPFPGKDVVERLGPRVTGEPPWIRTVRPDVPPGLEAVIRTMMARRPEDRYQTPLEAARALEPFAAAPSEATSLPVAQLAGGVALASPVAPGAIANGAAMAMPVAPESSEDPSFLEMTATGRDLSSGAAARTPPAGKPRQAFPVKIVLFAGGALLLIGLLGCGICLIRSWFQQPTGIKGAIVITKAEYSVPSQKLQPAQRKFLNVYVERSNCKGPLTITLLDLPSGVRAEPATIRENSSEQYVPINVSDIKPISTQIRVRVESEDGVIAEKTIPLVVVARKN